MTPQAFDRRLNPETGKEEMFYHNKWASYKDPLQVLKESSPGEKGKGRVKIRTVYQKRTVRGEAHKKNPYKKPVLGNQHSKARKTNRTDTQKGIKEWMG